MRFERFDSSGRSYTPQVTISAGGYLSFNAGACRRFHIDGFTHVVLYFSPEDRMIGFEFTNDETAKGARKLQQRDPSAGLYAKSFLDYYGIKRSKRQTFEPSADDDSGLLIIGPVDVIDVALRKRTSSAETTSGDASAQSAT